MAGELSHYSQWIRQQRCDACGGPGPCEPHHALYGTTYSPNEPKPAKAIEGARKGKAQRSHDWFLISLHTRCHAQFHDGRGRFEGWTTFSRNAWEAERVETNHALYDREFPKGPPTSKAPKKERVRSPSEGPAASSDALTKAWVAGANAERARIAEWLITSAATMCSAESAAVLVGHARILSEKTQPMARRHNGS